MSWAGIAAAGIGAAGAITSSAISKKKAKGGGGGFAPQPYSGLRPQRPEFLKPTEKLTYETLSRRSQGQDVGYDPKRSELLRGLVKSENNARLEDDLRDANGRLSSSGLSGNPRAYEALAGRTRRDSARSLNDNMSKIAIEDLTYASNERDINTARLTDFNKFNFGQDNNAAAFDLDVYNAENGNNQAAAGADQQASQFSQSRQDGLMSDLGGLVMGGVSLASGNKSPIITGGNPSGTGIAPPSNSSGMFSNIPLNRTSAYRNLVR